MDWVWIAALAWVVAAIPLALLIGRYLLRSDELEAGSRQAPDDVPQRRSDERSASRRPGRSPSRRSTPHPAAIRSVHLAERCLGDDGPGHDLTPPTDRQPDPSAGRVPQEGHPKPPLDHPWRRMASHRRP